MPHGGILQIHTYMHAYIRKMCGLCVYTEIDERERQKDTHTHTQWGQQGEGFIQLFHTVVPFEVGKCDTNSTITN